MKVDLRFPNECWLWTASCRRNGYGMFNLSRKGEPQQVWSAHRLAYVVLVGCLPAGKDLDHLCRQRRCVNPFHLEPVRRRDNLLRSPVAPAGVNSAKTHCPQGHPYDDVNTYWWKGMYGNPTRLCRACQRERGQASRGKRLHKAAQ